MRTLLSGGLLLTVSALPSVLAAQQPPAIGQDKASGIAKVDDRTQIAIEFTDPGNHTAKAVAESLGISVGEATSRLRTQTRSAALIARLEKQFPDTFADLEFTRGPAMRVRALFKAGGDPGPAVTTVARESGIEQPVEIGTAVLSRTDQRQFAERLIAALRSSGKGQTWFEVDTKTGSVTIGASEDQVLRQVAEAASQGLPIKISFDPALTVVQTTFAVAGQDYNSSISTGTDPNNCTIGFSVSSGTRNTTTAGHCANGTAEFNPYHDTEYGSGSGNTIAYVGQSVTNGADVQWYRTTEADDDVAAYYWNGSYSVGVTATFKSYPGNGTYLCKYGVITRWDCGTVTGSAYSGTYGGPFYVVESSTTSLSELGDSGGPVVAGSVAYGWIHGYSQTTRRMVYSTIRNVYDFTPLALLICTANC